MSSPSRKHAVIIAVSVLLVVQLVRTAWVSDEAYLTFRTVDNWMHGYGLRWNPLERVQAFAHPLWLFLVAAGYALTGEPYYSVLALSALITLAAVAIILRRVACGPAQAAGAGTILLLSKAFVDFSTSGLEPPLTYLLIAVFFAAFFDERNTRTTKMAWAAGLLAVTRLDAVLLVLPALVVAMRRDDRGSFGRRLLLAALPWIAWEIFATIYYGFPLPNSAYAWAAAAPPLATRIRHGSLYLLDSIDRDPITIATLVATTAMAADGALAAARPIAIGVVLDLMAILWTGGDAMSGRLLAAPLLCAAIAASRVDLSGASMAIRAQALALIVLLGLMAPRETSVNSQGLVPIESERTGIADARLVAFPATGLLHVIETGTPPNAMAAEGGHAARDAHRAVVPSGGNLVPAAFFAGPTVHVIDRAGDGDPLLARLPPTAPALAGVALRDMPDGYEETVVLGVNRIAAPALAAYYDRLAVITRAPLMNTRRLREIVSMNLMPAVKAPPLPDR